MRKFILSIALCSAVLHLSGQLLSSRHMPANPEYLLWHRAQEIPNSQLAPTETSSIRPSQRSGMIITTGLSGTYYQGDLNYLEGAQGLGSSHIAFYPGVHVSVRNHNQKRCFPLLQVGYAKFVSQNDQLQPTKLRWGERDTFLLPNHYSETVHIYGDLLFRLQPLSPESSLQPYLSAGVGGLFFFPRAEDGLLLYRKKSTRSPNEIEYGTLTYSFPIQAGLEYHWNHKVGIYLSYSYRFSGSDYLDNISQLGSHRGNDRLHQFQIGMLLYVQ